MHWTAGVFESVVLAGVPVTRIPEGAQGGRPSALDHVAAKPTSNVTLTINWEIALADHAGLIFIIPCNFVGVRHPPPRRWRCDDAAPCCHWLELNSQTLPPESEPLAVLSYLAFVQDEFGD